MKKTITQFRWLVTMLLLVTAMAMPKMTWAQVKYTEFDSSSGTLTFKYGEKPSGGGGITVYDIPDASSSPDWKLQVSSSIKTVVFDESFKNARPTTCFAWFQNCSSLTTINGIENLNTAEVTDMDYMFHNCSSLTTLDLSAFNTANVNYMEMMFCNCSKLTTIYASSNFTTSIVTSSDYMFTDCTSLVGAIKYDSSKTDASYANYHTGYLSYGINTVDDLKTFANKVNGTYTPAEGETATPYTAICAGLMANITLTDADNLPAIGSGGYSGTFDGCGHTISGLNFSSASSALFAQNSGTIKNLGIAEATIAESANGYLCQTNEGTIKNCFFMGTATGSSQGAGGICQTNNGTITNCYYLADSETDAIDGTTYKTTAQFRSGEVCYLLNGSSPYGEWGQQIGTNDYPIISSAYKVLRAAQDGLEGTNYWATFSNRNSNAELKATTGEITVYNATVSGGTLTLTKRSDNKVALGEGVLLKANCEYVNAMNISDEVSAAATEENHLVATPTTAQTITAETDYTLYRLTYNETATKEGLGFYLGIVGESKNGSQLKATPGKAYLKVSTGAATNTVTAALARSFVFPGDDEATGIGKIVIEGDADTSGSANANGRIYNLQGQQVTKPSKGVYIINNKKVIIR